MCFTNAAVVAFSGPDFEPPNLESGQARMWGYRTYLLCKKGAQWECFEDHFKTGGQNNKCGVAAQGYPMGEEFKYETFGGNTLRAQWRMCGVQQIQPDSMNIAVFETVGRCVPTEDSGNRPAVSGPNDTGNPLWQELKLKIDSFQIIRTGTCLAQGLGMMEHIQGQTAQANRKTADDFDVTYASRGLVITDGDVADMDAVKDKVRGFRERGTRMLFLMTNMNEAALEQNIPMCEAAVNPEPTANDFLYDHCKVVVNPLELNAPWLTNQVLNSMCVALSDATKAACQNELKVDNFLDEYPATGYRPLDEPEDTLIFDSSFLS